MGASVHVGGDPWGWKAQAATSPVLSRSPVLVERALLVEAFVVGLHVTQAGVVIGVNEGQVNLKAGKAAAGGGGQVRSHSANQGGTCRPPARSQDHVSVRLLPFVGGRGLL